MFPGNWIRYIMTGLLSQAAYPVIKSTRMDPMLFAPLVICEAAAPAFHDQLILLVCWYSGLVSRHCLKPRHNSVVKCQHLSKRKKDLGVKCLHLAILIMRQMAVKYQPP